MKFEPLPYSLPPIALPRSQRFLHSDARSRPDLSQINHPRSQDIVVTQAYSHLHQQALRGNYKEVQEIVKRLVQEQGEKPNSRLYEALVLANTDSLHGSASEVAKLLQDMTKENVEPDSGTLHGALQVLAVHPDYLLRSHVLNELRQRWISLTQNGWHDVVVGLLRDRQLENALENLKQMQRDGIQIRPWLYDLTIYTLCSAEEFDEALRLLEHRLDSGELLISPTLWSHTLDAASRALHYPLTLFAFNARVQTSYLNPSSGTCTNILSTAARNGDAHLATSVICILSRRSGGPIQLHHYEALLETYIAGNNLRTALMLLTTMTKAGHPPSEASTRPIFSYLRQSKHRLSNAQKALSSLRDEGCTIPIQAINVVIESHIHHQNLPAAMELYKSMQTLSSDLTPDTATFNTLLRGCARCERKDSAMFLASEMLALKVLPDMLTYDRLILVCLSSDKGLDDAWRYLEEMKAAGWQPRGGTAHSLARKACTLGDRRVWELVGNEPGAGLPRERVEALVMEYWNGGEKAAQTEIGRACYVEN